MNRLSLKDACDILDILGSGEDPIVTCDRCRKETTPRDLLYEGDDPYGKDARKVRVEFYSEKGLRKGTLAEMVLDRLGVKEVK